MSCLIDLFAYLLSYKNIHTVYCFFAVLAAPVLMTLTVATVLWTLANGPLMARVCRSHMASMGQY